MIQRANTRGWRSSCRLRMSGNLSRRTFKSILNSCLRNQAFHLHWARSTAKKELCDKPQPQHVGWFDLFPTEQPAERNLSASAPAADISSKSVVIKGEKPRKFVGFYVVGCVTYRSSFGAEFHQTHFAYHVIGPLIVSSEGRPLVLPNGAVAWGGFEVGVSAPQNQVGFMQELFSLNDAN